MARTSSGLRVIGGSDRALRFLLRSSRQAEPDRLPDLIHTAYLMVGAQCAVPYLIDYEQAVLTPLIPACDDLDNGPALVELPLDEEAPGQAFMRSEIVTGPAADHDGEIEWWIPILDGTERLGVMLVRVLADDVTDQLMDDCEVVEALAAELLIAKGAYSDFVEARRRSIPMTLPAEMQWRLLPPLTMVTPRVAISGVLVPSYAVAGDSFDYAINGEVAHIAIFDAMGHGLEAALMASVALTACRNCRRTGMGLTDSARGIDKAVSAQFGPDRFVTGVLAELHLQTGVYRWINAGHPPVILVRRGEVVRLLDEDIHPPFGLWGDHPVVASEQLEPGDRLVAYSDGVTEARTVDGEFFGIEGLLGAIVKEEASGLPVAETMRRLTAALREHHEGVLEDDATTVMVNWFGPRPHLAPESLELAQL